MQQRAADRVQELTLELMWVDARPWKMRTAADRSAFLSEIETLQAARALDGARLLLRDGKTEGACSRAYYAMHDAAHAALLATGHETPDAIIKTHHSLLAELESSLFVVA